MPVATIVITILFPWQPLLLVAACGCGMAAPSPPSDVGLCRKEEVDTVHRAVLL